jgi:hypothetical protein
LGLPTIYVDGDGCPVKDEVYKVAKRCGVQVKVVANSWMQMPDSAEIELVVVGQGFDEADDWIVDHAADRDVVITADIPLAARCLKNGARVIGPKGRVFTDETIGDALAKREILSSMREHGEMTGGPAPFQQKDRSRFLQRLDETVRACLAG